jgi:hypothetical protein
VKPGEDIAAKRCANLDGVLVLGVTDDAGWAAAAVAALDGWSR